MTTRSEYIPALGLDFLTPLYDPVLRYVMREAIFRRRLVDEAALEPGQHVLDVGSGTGTLAIMLKQRYPDAHVHGVDIDPAIIAIAARKAVRANVPLDLLRGVAFCLPYMANRFDLVVSSLVLHHLKTTEKEQTVAEMFRVLRPGGRFLVVDFGVPHTSVARLVGVLSQYFEEVADNVQGRLRRMFDGAGFTLVDEAAHFMTPLGTLTLYSGRKPAAAHASI